MPSVIPDAAHSALAMWGGDVAPSLLSALEGTSVSVTIPWAQRPLAALWG